MMSDQDPPEAPRPARSRALVGLGVVGVIGAAAAVWFWVVPMMREGEPAGPAAAGTQATARTKAPAPAVETPAPAIEASRDARPRPKKPADPPPPPQPREPAPPTTGELTIDSDVPGALVFLDRQYLGTAPVTARDITPGKHHLNVTAEGYESHSEPFEVAAGPATVMVKFKEIRLAETIDVVHKHAIGSCEGRLVADPQGVRYETGNKDDAFALTFSEIETFEVDYLKKNLRIKKRGGKQYNFTTKTESADPLFVFHRNVEKVRQRVIGPAPAKR